MNDPIRMTAHAIGAALDFNEIDAEDMFVDAPSYDALASQLAEVQSLRNAEAKTAQALIDALRTQNTALIKQMGVSVENERQWGERVAGLEADLQEMTCGDAKTLLERTLQAGYDIQTRQRDEIRELRKALREIANADPSPTQLEQWVRWAMNKAFNALTPTETPPRRDQFCSNEYSELGTAEGSVKDLRQFAHYIDERLVTVERELESSKETIAKPPTWEDLRGAAPDATGALSSEAFVRQSRNEWDKETSVEPVKGVGQKCHLCHNVHDLMSACPPVVLDAPNSEWRFVEGRQCGACGHWIPVGGSSSCSLEHAVPETGDGN